MSLFSPKLFEDYMLRIYVQSEVNINLSILKATFSLCLGIFEVRFLNLIRLLCRPNNLSLVCLYFLFIIWTFFFGHTESDRILRQLGPY